MCISYHVKSLENRKQFIWIVGEIVMSKTRQDLYFHHTLGAEIVFNKVIANTLKTIKQTNGILIMMVKPQLLKSVQKCEARLWLPSAVERYLFNSFSV